MIEKSLEFIKNRIKDGVIGMKIEDFENSLTECKILDLDFIKKYLNSKNEIKARLDFTKEDGIIVENLTIIIRVDEDADFDYFTTESCLCDGTLYFYHQLISECLNKILRVETYFKEYILPEDFSNKTFVYTVGNFVLGHEYNEHKFQTEEKPWLCSRFTAMLPIKFEVI